MELLLEPIPVQFAPSELASTLPQRKAKRKSKRWIPTGTETAETHKKH